MSLYRRLAALDDRVLGRRVPGRYDRAAALLGACACGASMSGHVALAGPFLGAVVTLAVLDVRERRSS